MLIYSLAYVFKFLRKQQIFVCKLFSLLSTQFRGKPSYWKIECEQSFMELAWQLGNAYVVPNGIPCFGGLPLLTFQFPGWKTRLFPAHSVGGGVGAPYCEIKCNVLYAHYLPTKKVHRRKVGESHRYSVFVVDASWTIISSEP